MNNELAEQIFRARIRSVPFISVTTSDPHKMPGQIVQYCVDYEIPPAARKNVRDVTVLHWDINRGIYSIGANDANQPEYHKRGTNWIKDQLKPKMDADSPFSSLQDSEEPTALNLVPGDPIAALTLLEKAPSGTMVFFHQADRWLHTMDANGKATVQAAASLRDQFKQDQRMLIFLSQQIDLPAELSHDTVFLNDPLPTTEELLTIFDQHKVLGRACPKEEDRRRLAAFTTGLSYFGAEQATYMSLKPDGKGGSFIDGDNLRSLRHNQIEQTRGLKVIGGEHNFDMVAGNKYVKGLLTEIMSGPNPPNGIVNVEEINWALAGSQGDNTGVSQDQVQVLLNHMESNNDEGIIFFGVPGCSKSWIVECLTGQFGVDTLQLDLNSLKQGEVGSSENNIRKALDVANAVSGGRKLWVATCNSVAGLNEALLRRFTYGILFFDLPNNEEKDAVWKIQAGRYGHKLTKKQWGILDTSGWSAADIRNCCRMAYNRNRAIADMALEINPVARQDPQMVNRYRFKAHGRYRSAHTGLIYKAPGRNSSVAMADSVIDQESEREIAIL